MNLIGAKLARSRDARLSAASIAYGWQKDLAEFSIGSQYLTLPVTAFYKGESQGKKLLQRLEEAGMFAFSPAHVMLGGSGFFFLQIHLVIVTTLSASDANKQCGGCQVPTMVLSETRGL